MCDMTNVPNFIAALFVIAKYWKPPKSSWASLITQMAKNPPAVQETWV